MISIVDYGLGNVQAFYNIYKNLGISCAIANDSSSLLDSKKLILPGVGSFDWAMHKLNISGMRETLDKLVVEKQVPILGVCVGMQIMAKDSEEGKAKGLGWIDAKNLLLKDTTANQIILPHMGWNDVHSSGKNLFQDLASSRFYFLHSYYIRPDDSNLIQANATYSKNFTCAVSKCNQIFGVQFHPEKSHNWGIKLLHNFSKL